MINFSVAQWIPFQIHSLWQAPNAQEVCEGDFLDFKIDLTANAQITVAFARWKSHKLKHALRVDVLNVAYASFASFTISDAALRFF